MKKTTLLLALTITLVGSAPTLAQDRHNNLTETSLSLGETIYVPAYSRVHTHERTNQSLASTVVVHNVDPARHITLTRVEYFDHEGNLLNKNLKKPLILGPFESRNFLTPINDHSGGIGANYIVEWRADAAAVTPVVEAVMIGGSGTHGISFTSRGRVISRTPAGSAPD